MDNNKLRVAIVGGLGLMASPMSRYWRNQQIIEVLRVHDRGSADPQRKEARRAWQDSGVKLVSSFAELITPDLDGVFVCCGKNGDDKSIIAQLANLLAQTAPNSFICHMSTVSISFVKAAHEYCLAKGIHYVNYPLTGGPVGAKNASMLILASGELALYERLKPALSLIGKPRYFSEGITVAAEVKLMGQLMVFNNLIGICSATAIQSACLNNGELGGTDQADFFDFLNGGAGGSRQWDIALSLGIRNNIWHQGFFIRHAVVDAVYAAQMCIDYKLSYLSIQPIINIVLALSFILNHADVDLATHAIVREMLANRAHALDEFIFEYSAPIGKVELGLLNCIQSLPEKIRNTVALNLSAMDF